MTMCSLSQEKRPTDCSKASPIFNFFISKKNQFNNARTDTSIYVPLVKIKIENIKNMVFFIRNQRVMLDSDLAKLYGAPLKRLNEQVRRNQDRFPADFALLPSSGELEDLRSQFATANRLSDWNYKRRSTPLLFTENGIAMLSSVLNSKQAIEVNIAIMRIFTKLRSFYMLEKDLDEKVENLKSDTNRVFKIVFERLDNLETNLPVIPNKRRKIGFKK